MRCSVKPQQAFYKINLQWDKNLLSSSTPIIWSSTPILQGSTYVQLPQVVGRRGPPKLCTALSAWMPVLCLRSLGASPEYGAFRRCWKLGHHTTNRYVPCLLKSKTESWVPLDLVAHSYKLQKVSIYTKSVRQLAIGGSATHMSRGGRCDWDIPQSV